MFLVHVVKNKINLVNLKLLFFNFLLNKIVLMGLGLGAWAWASSNLDQFKKQNQLT
jgi:hypothetical protein